MAEFVYDEDYDLNDLPSTSKAAAVGQFFFLVAYVVLDLSMLIWGFHLKSRIGEPADGYILQGMLGFGDNFRKSSARDPRPNAS